MLKMKYLVENFDLAREALKNYDHDEAASEQALSWFRISANAVYPFFSGGELCFLRLAPAEEKDLLHVKSEIGFIAYLRGCKYGAMEPIPNIHGETVMSLDTVWGRYIVSAFRQVPGKQLEEVALTQDVLCAYGAALGQLHRLSESYVPREKRGTYETVIQWLREELSGADVPAHMLRQLELVREGLDALPRSREVFGLVHYDFEMDNVFWDQDSKRCHVIDFDDSMYHWFAVDVEQVFDCLADQFCGPALDAAKEQFLEGYRREHPFTAKQQQALPLMRSFIDLYSYGRLRHCLSELPPETPEWMVQLQNRLKTKMRALEASYADR